MKFTRTDCCNWFFAIVLLSFSLLFNPVHACDSSMLEILTGSSSQQSVTAKILAVSQKMQQAANLLKSFNHAAASRLHGEVMEDWLYIASQVAIDLRGSAADSLEFSSLLMQIAQDLGRVRRKLESDQLDYIHEILEACITRMSLVSAIINGQQRVREFLEIELLLYGIRPLFSDLAVLTAMAGSSTLIARLAAMQPHLATETAVMIPVLGNLYQDYCQSLQLDRSKVSSATQAAFQKLLNHFVKFKQTLLNSNYFKKL